MFLYGCAQTNILDKVGLTTLVGYDVGTEDKIKTTAVIREVNPEFQSNVEVLSTENDTSKGNRMEANRKLSKNHGWSNESHPIWRGIGKKTFAIILIQT